MSEATPAVVCSWCIAEGLVERVPDCSDGICEAHLEALYPEDEEAA